METVQFLMSYASQIAWLLVNQNSRNSKKDEKKSIQKPPRVSGTQKAQAPVTNKGTTKTTASADDANDPPEKKKTTSADAETKSNEKEGGEEKKKKQKEATETATKTKDDGLDPNDATKDVTKDEKAEVHENTLRIEMVDDDHTKTSGTVDASACFDAHDINGVDQAGNDVDDAKLAKKSSKHARNAKKIGSQKKKAPAGKKKKKNTTEDGADGKKKKKDGTQESVDCDEKKKKEKTIVDRSDKKEPSPNSKGPKSGNAGGGDKMETMVEDDGGKQLPEYKTQEFSQ
ncbi:unnamed protein product [Caenorhabditis sp. 36 PRJEB53466]|nr:unnamed protein product [Caenorhabditis sp. 36 PRJEB53466]